MILQIQQRESCGGGQFPQAPAIAISTIRWPGSITLDKHLSGCIP
jgi:hypothetical protein